MIGQRPGHLQRSRRHVRCLGESRLVSVKVAGGNSPYYVSPGHAETGSDPQLLVGYIATVEAIEQLTRPAAKTLDEQAAE